MKLFNNKHTAKHLPGRKNRMHQAVWFLCLALIMVLATIVAPFNSNIGTVKAGDIAVISGGATIANSKNLADYIGGMTLQKMNADGEWVDIETGEDIVLGNNYKLKVHFEGGVGGFQEEMTWYMGDSVTCKPKTGAPVRYGNTQIGTYDLTEDGHVTVHFNPDFLDEANQILDMEFEMIATGNGEGGDSHFPWEGKIEGHDVVAM